MRNLPDWIRLRTSDSNGQRAPVEWAVDGLLTNRIVNFYQDTCILHTACGGAHAYNHLR
jgi:hypothetical protein